ncbi:hypothetical protein BSZ39_00115 [Bowdeniella nasicola]|uniref:Ribosome maturation factor RimP n=1 Tax=Bowdeniella nasicola TaxID=208480 RepID=A0A1Q5Q5P6_9ACTO|nr:ribosome maturation factor RimP [Bowdeniella nasicola]OKL55145.1 hypothetical protein BSZ39_00115 [Bowdeniella nasicola]
MTGSREAELRELLAPVARAAGLIVEDVKIAPAGKKSLLRVTVDLPDGPGSVDSDTLTDVSREISALMDDNDPIKGAYTLEVSTAGITRPLTTPRHFRRTQGHEIEFIHHDKKLVGRVVDASDADASVTIDVGGETQTIPLDELRKARVRISM